jgi:hypothetical protein
MDAKEALDRQTVKLTSGFASAFNRWKDNREKIAAYKAGLWKPENKYEVDWTKVGYTAFIQLLNLGVAAGCIFTGNWPVAIFSIPGLITLNLLFLNKDK